MAETVRIEIPIDAVDNTAAGLNSAQNRVTKFEKSVDKTTKQIERLGRTRCSVDIEAKDKATQSTEKLESKLKGITTKTWAAIIEAKDHASQIITTVSGHLKTISGKVWNTTVKVLDKATAPIRGIIDLLKNPVVQAGAVLGVSFGIKESIDTYKDFEATMSRVKALSGASKSDMVALTDKAIEMGQKTKYSGKESAEAFTYMAQAGWGTKDMLNGIGGIMSLAASDGLALSAASDIVSNGLTAFGLKSSDAAHFADVLAVASSATTTDVTGLGEAFTYAGSLAGSMGYSVEDVSMALGLMANNAVKGSMAGTSLKTAIANMAHPSKQMATAMEKYGISLTDTKGNMKSLRGVLDNIRGSLGGLSKDEQVAAAATIFGKEAMAGMLGIINTAPDKYEELSNQIQNANGAADKMATTMQDNLAGSLEQLGGALDTVKQNFGERLAPYVKEIANGLQDALPDLDDSLERMMDKFDKAKIKLQEKIKSMTATDAWKNADLLGKIKISWDELIGKPFESWWSTKGQQMIADKAMRIGKGIGTGIRVSILALLGLDYSDAAKDGASIGQAFAKGFSNGLKVEKIMPQLGKGMVNMTKSAGKLLPGGEAPDLNSIISAAVLAKVASPALKGIGGLFKAGGAIKGAAGNSAENVAGSVAGKTPGLISKIWGTYDTTAKMAGYGSVEATGISGLLGKLGAALGSTASEGGAIAAGAGSVGGAVAGAFGIYSGIKDLIASGKENNSLTKEQNKKIQDAQNDSGMTKLVGVGAGAATGALIGSVVPVIGTAVGALVGAGIGAIGGMAFGDSKKSTAEKQVNADVAAEKERAATAALNEQIATEQAKYGTDKMKESVWALREGFIDSAEFADRLNKEVQDGIVKHFGKIHLTMKEIKTDAEALVFNGQKESVEEFSNATKSAENSLSTLKTAYSGMNKTTWKVSLGAKLSQTDYDNLTTQADQMVTSAKSYIEDKHYEAKVALNLLMEGQGGPQNITTGGMDTMYQGLQDKIDSLGGELKAKIKVGVDGGELDTAGIQDIQDQIQKITDQIASAESDASFETLKIKFKGAALDPQSFSDMQSQLQEQTAGLTSNYDDALKVTLTNLKLELGQGAISQEDYDQQVQAATEGYEAHIKELKIRVEGFQLDSVAGSYTEELANAFNLDSSKGDIGTQISGKLNTSIQDALKTGIDPSQWTATPVNLTTVVDAMGLSGLPAEVQAQLVPILAQVAATIPEDSSKSITDGLNMGLTTAGATPLDASSVGTNVTTAAGNAITAADRGPINSAVSGVYTDTASQINSQFANPFSTNASVNVKLNWNLLNPTASLLVNGGAGVSGSGQTVSATLLGNAEGGIYDKPHLSMVSEDGPEAIIPMAPEKRQRGIGLWRKAANMLGIPQYAEGGIVGDTSGIEDQISTDGGETYDSSTAYQPSAPTNQNASGSSTPAVQVSVKMSPTFEIQGGGGTDDNKIMQIIRSKLKSLTDEVAGEMAEQLRKTFSNMPVKEA